MSLKKPGKYLLYAIATICFIIFGIIQLGADGSIIQRTDSGGYLGISEFSIGEIFSGKEYCFDQYYCQNRPVLIPLVYKLCQQNKYLIVKVQLVFSLLSWLFVAGCAASLIQKPLLRQLLFCAVLGLGSTPNITRWNNTLLSESVTLSLTIIMLGFLILFSSGRLRFWSWPYLSAFLLVCTLLLMARDPSIWTIAFAALLLVLCGWYTQRRRALISALIMLLLCGLFMSTTGDRWKFSYFNVLFVRILNDTQSEAYFMDRGIPRPPEVDQLKGYKHTQTFPVFNSPALIPLREWVKENGLRVYTGWLIYRASDTLRAPWYDHFEREAYESVDSIYKNDDSHTLMPPTLSKFFMLNMPGIVYGLAGLTGVYFFIARRKNVFCIPTAFILTSYIFCTMIYSLDAYDFARQSVEVFTCMRLSAWLMLFLLSEHFLQSFNQQDL